MDISKHIQREWMSMQRRMNSRNYDREKNEVQCDNENGKNNIREKGRGGKKATGHGQMAPGQSRMMKGSGWSRVRQPSNKKNA